MRLILLSGLLFLLYGCDNGYNDPLSKDQIEARIKIYETCISEHLGYCPDTAIRLVPATHHSTKKGFL